MLPIVRSTHRDYSEPMPGRTVKLLGPVCVLGIQKWQGLERLMRLEATFR